MSRGDGRGRLVSLDQRAQRILALRGHAKEELRRKLLARGFAREDVDGLIEEYEGRGWLDDAETLRQQLPGEVRAGWGPRMVRHRLRARGFDPADIDAAIAAIPDEAWQRAARRRLERRYGPVACWNRETAVKAARWLRRRGYQSDQIDGLMGTPKGGDEHEGSSL